MICNQSYSFNLDTAKGKYWIAWENFVNIEVLYEDLQCSNIAILGLVLHWFEYVSNLQSISSATKTVRSFHI